MLRLTESGGAFTIQAPLWIGLLVLCLGVALVVYVLRGMAVGKAVGASIAGVICIGFGWHLMYAKTRFDETGVFVRSGTGTVAIVPWTEVSAVRLQERSVSRGGRQLFLVLTRDFGPEIEVQVSGLDPEGRGHLVRFVREQSAQ